MGRHFGIINLVAIIFLSALIFAYVTYIQKETEDFERLRLSIQIDYATDAGTSAMLGTSDLGMDYANMKYSNINPNLGLDTFLTVFAFGYDMLPTEENKQLIKQYIPVVGVATFDGYYIGTQRLVKNATDYPDAGGENDSDWDLTFGMKMPYTYSYGGVQYALNMSTDYAWKMSGNTLSRHDGHPPTSTGSLDEDDIWHIINKSISDDMAYTVAHFNESNPNWSNQFYVPDKLTDVSGVNPIKGPSLLVLVQGLDFTTPRKISGFSISGARIDNARMVIAYQRNGINYYSFADKMPPGVDIENVYSSVKDAAEAGYYADVQYIQ